MIRSRAQVILGGCLAAFAVLIAVILYAPLAVSLVYSVVPQYAGKLQWTEATIRWYFRLWDDPLIVPALRNTAIVGLGSVAVSTLLALVLAGYCSSRVAMGRWLLEVLILLPFVLPPMITGISLLIYTQSLGIPPGLWSVVLGHTLFVLAIVYRLIVDRLMSIPESLLDAAADLGANRVQTARLVIWPMLRPVLLTSSILAFALSFDETLITAFLAGTDMTLPVRLWAMMRVGFTPSINALVTLIILGSAILTVVLVKRLIPARADEE